MMVMNASFSAMKTWRVASFLFLTLPLAALNAQTLPNPGFENWVTVGTACENPTHWDSPNEGVALFGVCSVFKETGSVQAGSAAVRLETILIPLVNLRAPAAISNGTLVVNASDPFNSTVQGGSPIWGRPDALTGYYRYAPQGGDSLTIRVRLYDITGTDTLLIAEDELTDDSNTGAYVPFTLPLNYLTLDDAELAQVLIRSTRNTTDATVGTTLWMDELRFTGITGVEAAANLPFGFNLYPNPASETLHIENVMEQNVNLDVYDQTGVRVLQSSLQRGMNVLDVRDLVPGLHVYRAYQSDGRLALSGTFQILR
jgi:hypothetical protein